MTARAARSGSLLTQLGDAGQAAVLVSASAIIGAAVLHGGFFALSDDDFSRVVIAQRFAHAPSLDPSGTSWLPFPFWLTGSAMLAFGRTLLVARGVALASNAVALVLVHRAALLLGQTRGSALVATLAAAALPTAARLGVSFQPEALTASLVLFAAAATAVNGKLRVAGGAALLVATLSRYEAWPAAAAFAAACLYDAAKGQTGEAYARRAALGAAALALAGPIAWIAHGVVRHGDALFFLHRVAAYRRALGVQSSLLDALAEYPLAALRAEPELCILGACIIVASARGAVAAARGPLHRPLLVLGAMVVFLLSARLWDGAPTHHAERPLLAVFWFAVLVLVSAAWRSLGAASSASTTWVVGVGAALVAGFFVRSHRAPDDGAPREAERCIGAIARELTPGAPLVVDTPDYGYFAVIAAYGAPERTTPLASHDPRLHLAGNAFTSPSALRTAVVDTCHTTDAQAPLTDCRVVLHHDHLDLASSLGPVLGTDGSFTLLAVE